MRFQLWSLLFVLVLAGCGAAASAGGGGGNSNLITSELLRVAETEGLSVYQVIQRNRPRWLRAGRGDTSFGNVAGGAEASDFAKVVLDGAPYGDLNTLRSINTVSVESLQFLSAADATTRFGTGYVGGAILVDTR